MASNVIAAVLGDLGLMTFQRLGPVLENAEGPPFCVAKVFQVWF
jgi:hypothetical protein